MNPSVTTIEVEELSYSYDTLEVLHGVSFCIRRGEIVGLLGPNGAGKTTTIKLVAGMLSPARGRIQVAGFHLPTQHLEVKRVIGFVPEAAGLYECLSGKEFRELSGRLHGVAEATLQKRIRLLLEVFELHTARVARIAGYSKGMRTNPDVQGGTMRKGKPGRSNTERQSATDCTNFANDSRG